MRRRRCMRRSKNSGIIDNQLFNDQTDITKTAHLNFLIIRMRRSENIGAKDDGDVGRSHFVGVALLSQFDQMRKESLGRLEIGGRQVVDDGFQTSSDIGRAERGDVFVKGRRIGRQQRTRQFTEKELE